MKKPSYPVTNIGSVSLLMTFIVLCLVIFSTLSLSGAVSEYHYSQRLAEHNQDYYSASNEASLLLCDIDTALDTAYKEDPDKYFSLAEEQLAFIPQIDTDFSENIPSVEYEVPISDSQILKVSLALNPPEELAKGYYKITGWKEISSTEWSSDDSLNLIFP